MEKGKDRATAILIQVVSAEGADAYRLLRDKITNEAKTWWWSNKKKTRLRHIGSTGHIDVVGAAGVLVARVYPKRPQDLYFLVEKFIGRSVAWFDQDLVALNVQFLDER